MTHSNKKINRLRATNEDTLGPYYPISLCDNDNMDMTKIRSGIVHRAQGEKIIIKGCVKDINGNHAHGCLLEFWQPNANGVYRTPLTEESEKIDPWFTGHARHRTSDGNFKLTTIMPGVDEDAAVKRAPSITLTIFSDGIMRVVTQLFFDDNPHNDSDPLLQSLPKEDRKRLMMKALTREDDGTVVYNIEVRMAGENETPFFDDMIDPDTTNGSHGRQLEIGPTDLTSEKRTPREPLNLIPEAADASFVPFTPHNFGPVPDSEADMTRTAPGRPRAEGDVIKVTGRITDQYGNPVRRSLIEVWNANKYGRYTHIEDFSGLKLDPNFLGIGRMVTDDDGNYEFWTIRPGEYLALPDISRWRPKHIHFSIRGGASRLITQMYFKGDPHNDRDPMRILMGDNFDANIGNKYDIDGDEFDCGYQFDIVIGGKASTFFE